MTVTVGKIYSHHFSVSVLFFHAPPANTTWGLTFWSDLCCYFGYDFLCVCKRHSFFRACLPEQTAWQSFTDAWRFKEFTLKSMTSVSTLDTGILVPRELPWTENSICLNIVEFVNKNNGGMVMHLSSAEFSWRIFWFVYALNLYFILSNTKILVYFFQ